MENFEAVTLLKDCKPLAQRLISSNYNIKLVPQELNSLNGVQKVYKAHLLLDDAVLQAADLSVDEVVVLLGACEFFSEN